MPETRRIDVYLNVEVSDPDVLVNVTVNKVVVISAKAILEAVCQVNNTTVQLLLSPCRKRPVVRTRQMAAAILRNDQHYKLVDAGTCLDRDHTTILNLVKQHENDLDRENGYADKFSRARTRLGLITTK